MMFNKRVLFFLLFSTILLSAKAQKIAYSEPDKDDTRKMVFDVAGKVSGNFLIYKNTRSNKHIISVLDNDMKELTSVEQTYMPNGDRVINVDFFPYSDFCYIIYQYQKKNIVYCMAAKIDGSGKTLGEPMELDTTRIGFAANNKLYSVETSEDKSKIMLFKINTKNKKLYLLNTKLYASDLKLLKESQIQIPMEERNEYLSEFKVDNEGNLVFTKFLRNNNDNITAAQLVFKYANSDSLIVANMNLDKIWLDEMHLKMDNYNKRYLLSSLYYKERRGNVDGLYFYIWDKNSFTSYAEKTYAFTDEQRHEAKGDASVKTAFNDYFVRNLIIRKDGGFIIGSESYYTTSRFNSWNRWDYLYGNPYMSPFGSNYYYPYYNNYWLNNSRNNNFQSVRYHADDIAVFSFSDKAELEWNNVIEKGQYDEASDDLLSYQLMNTGGELHFLFNLQERRNNLLNDFSIAPDGQLAHNPTLKNLDKGYEFMPKYGKQVSSRQLIIPCTYRNYICFAKVEYN